MPDIDYLLHAATTAARSAAQAILRVYLLEDFDIKRKPDESPVTVADLQANSIINEELSKTGIPVISEENAGVPYSEREKWEYVWIVDPLDGTREFISRNGEFTINIALVQKNMPIAGVIYAPAKQCLYAGSSLTGVYKTGGGRTIKCEPLAERVRMEDLLSRPEIRAVASRSHITPETKIFLERFRNVKLVSMGSSLKFMMLIDGQADIYPRHGITSEWDTAAAHALLHATNRGVYLMDQNEELHYNKPDLRNPYFVAY